MTKSAEKGCMNRLALHPGGEEDGRNEAATIYVVVPAYNEESAIAGVIADLARVVPAQHIIVIDDGSSDATYLLAQQTGAIVLRHFINRGQGAAIATGIELALKLGADIIVTFDADGQHRATDILELAKPIILGSADVVLGNRFLKYKPEGIRKDRYLILKLGAIFTWLVSGIRVSDCQNGLRALSRKAARSIQIKQDRMAHASEILDEIAREKLKYTEVPVKVIYTEHSLGKGQKTSSAFSLALRFLVSRLIH